MNLTSRAERFLRGVYGGDLAVVDELAADGIVLSYPIFQTLFGVPALHGRDAAREFAASFARKWADQVLTVHASIADGRAALLVWEFSARNVGARPGETAPDGEVHAWGGMSLLRFDADGRVVADIGEESSPGPAGRVGTDVTRGT